MEKTKKNILIFGYGLSIILSILATLHWKRHSFDVFSSALYFLSFCFLLVSMFGFKLLEIIYDRWMIVANVIGKIMTIIIMSMLFYLIFTPVGLVLRVLKKDFLDRALKKEEKSYWIKKENLKYSSKESYRKQF